MLCSRVAVWAVLCAGFDTVEGGLLECVKGMGWLKHISAIYCGYCEQKALLWTTHLMYLRLSKSCLYFGLFKTLRGF